jgi:hypothetical protein
MTNVFQTSKTHCPHGHEYTPENTKLIKSTKPGHFKRQCRACKAMTAKRLSQQAKDRRRNEERAAFTSEVRQLQGAL